MTRARIGIALALLAAGAWPADAGAGHALTYQGSYVNGMLAGVTADGRSVAIMAGTHDDFPYHDRGSDYDQLAVWVQGSPPVVRTGRPTLPDLGIDLEGRAAAIAYAGGRVGLRVRTRLVRHTPRYYGDPAQLGDLAIAMGYEPSEDAPGLVYTPYALDGLRRGTLRIDGERLRLARLHGQFEAGHIDAPADPRFRSAYDYLAAPSLGDRSPYTHVAFSTHALHSGLDGALDLYLQETGSDSFTLEAGGVAQGNPHGVPAPFDNTGALPAGTRALARWSVDLGPGILNRAFVRLRDRDRRPLLALSETIAEDR